MLNKIKRYSKGRSGPVEYELNERVEEGTAVLLRGNEKHTKHLIRGINRVHKYLAGGLMFHKDDAPTEAQQYAIMDSFEKMAFYGLDRSQYNILWARHEDKGTVELNYIIPRVELSSGKDLDIYTNKRDKPLFSMWQNGINKHYGFADPNAESRKRTPAEKAKAQSKDNIKTSFISKRGELDEKLFGLVSRGVLTSKDEIIKLLKSEGFEITRNNAKSVSVKHETIGKTALKLKNRPIYADSFKSLKDLDLASVAKVIDEPIPFVKSTYDKYLQSRAERHLKRYGIKPTSTPIPTVKNKKEVKNDSHREIASSSTAEAERNRRRSGELTRGSEIRTRSLSDFYADDSRLDTSRSQKPSENRSGEEIRRSFESREADIWPVKERIDRTANSVQNRVKKLVRDSFSVNRSRSQYPSENRSREANTYDTAEDKHTDNSIQDRAREVFGESFGVCQQRNTKTTKTYFEKLRERLVIVSRQVKELTNRERLFRQAERFAGQLEEGVTGVKNCLSALGQKIGYIGEKLMKSDDNSIEYEDNFILDQRIKNAERLDEMPSIGLEIKSVMGEYEDEVKTFTPSTPKP